MHVNQILTHHHRRLLRFLFIHHISNVRYETLRVELLLIRLHVHVALQLSASRAELEPEVARLSLVVQFSQALNTTVLERVLEASGEVRNKLADRTMVDVSKLRLFRMQDISTYPR